jgi:hypothetical protein
MERNWSGNARRLSHADRSEIERLIWGGETFETAAAVVGVARPSRSRAGGNLARPAGWGVSPGDREAAEESPFDRLARRGLERIARPLSRVAIRQRGGRARPKTQAFETSDRLEVVP